MILTFKGNALINLIIVLTSATRDIFFLNKHSGFEICPQVFLCYSFQEGKPNCILTWCGLDLATHFYWAEKGEYVQFDLREWVLKSTVACCLPSCSLWDWLLAQRKELSCCEDKPWWETEASCQQPREFATLVVDPPAVVKLSDDSGPADVVRLLPHERSWVRTNQPSYSRIPIFKACANIINVFGFSCSIWE